MKGLLSVLAASILISAPLASADAAAIVPHFSTVKPMQGDTVMVSVPTAASSIRSASFGGKAIIFFPYHSGARGLLPIGPASATGSYRFSLVFNNGRTYRKTITVRRRTFPLIDLGVPSTVSSTADQVVEKFGEINTGLAAIVNATTTKPAFTGPFMLPLTDATHFGAPFGELRKTGDFTVRHLGTDLIASSGTPVLSINAGKVLFAASDDLYGNTIVIDHGAGVVSLYLHLSRMDVTVGDLVARGQTIGAVGATGYAFGPHLHLSIKINGTAVDPIRFIRSF